MKRRAVDGIDVGVPSLGDEDRRSGRRLRRTTFLNGGMTLITLVLRLEIRMLTTTRTVMSAMMETLMVTTVTSTGVAAIMQTIMVMIRRAVTTMLMTGETEMDTTPVGVRERLGGPTIMTIADFMGAPRVPIIMRTEVVKTFRTIESPTDTVVVTEIERGLAVAGDMREMLSTKDVPEPEPLITVLFDTDMMTVNATRLQGALVQNVEMTRRGVEARMNWRLNTAGTFVMQTRVGTADARTGRTRSSGRTR